MAMNNGKMKKKAPSRNPAPWRSWGEDLDPKAVQQMADGCSLPVAVRGALMPDAHVGYGLPIGGVLAVDNAVIPYGVGMDIACRMKMSVFPVSADIIKTHAGELARAIEEGPVSGSGVSSRRARIIPSCARTGTFPR
jgi:tRNA-splicing ligase RtcB (3'-phosphate/5'-hydroxy nucleic acid ligase)